jgi:hypothetical protein
MALTAEGAALTEAHRTAQLRNAAIVALLVSRYWHIQVRPEQIAQTAEAWVDFLVPFVLRFRTQSEDLAAAYFEAFRTLEAGSNALEPFKPTRLDPLSEDAVRASLWATGPAAFERKLETIEGDRRLVQGAEVPPNPVVEKAQIQAAFDEAGKQAGGSAVRHVQNGGREQIMAASAEDKRCLGFLRVTDGDPCAFCAMMASRGPVYKEDSFDFSDPRFVGPGTAKAHDHCGCHNEPVYGRRTEWPGVAAQAHDIWSGTGSLLEFRREWDRLRRSE